MGTDAEAKLRALVKRWRSHSEQYDDFDICADELEAALAQPAPVTYQELMLQRVPPKHIGRAECFEAGFAAGVLSAQAAPVTTETVDHWREVWSAVRTQGRNERL